MEVQDDLPASSEGPTGVDQSNGGKKGATPSVPVITAQGPGPILEPAATAADFQMAGANLEDLRLELTTSDQEIANNERNWNQVMSGSGSNSMLSPMGPIFEREAAQEVLHRRC